MMQKVAALFVMADGVYANLPHVEVWDKARDARKYAGPWPVVAHPPCERWHMLSAVNAKRWNYRINDDDGCFEAALAAVRRYGGVLEHPAETRAFRLHKIPEPGAGAWQMTIDGDWVTEVNQAAYGHRATKRTWLLCHGINPPTLDWRNARGTHQIGFFDQRLPQLPKPERAATPEQFRDLLILIAMTARPQEL